MNTASILKYYGYHEWLSKTNFSFLTGASHPLHMVEQAMKFGYHSLCVNDFDGVYGLARAYREIQRLKQEQNLNPVKLNYSAEVHLQKDHDSPVLLHNTLVLGAKNKKGYKTLCELLSYSHKEGKLYAHLPKEHILSCDPDGLFVIQPMRGHIRTGPNLEWLGHLKDHFKDSFYFSLSRHLHHSEDRWINLTMSLAKRLEAPCLLSQDAFFHSAQEKPLSDLLHAIRTNNIMQNCSEHFFPNGERSLHSLKYIESLFKDLPVFEKAMQDSYELNEQCVFNFNQLKYSYPNEMIPEGYESFEYLVKLTWEGAEKRYGKILSDKVRQMILHELDLVRKLDFADYFLTVWDIVRWAREQDILCQGRGSAANSIVCFCLGITSADPVSFDLLFERFISQERGDPPDIDVDFEHERREEVVQYIYQRYGRKRAAMVANVITYRRKGALRSVGKAFGAPEELLTSMSRLTESKYLRREKTSTLLQEIKKNPNFDVPELHMFPWALWVEMAEKLKGFPRHLGIHSGGFIISNTDLNELVPQEPATMEGRTVVQWCKEDIEGLGFFKIDVLCLGILTAIRKCFGLIKDHYGKELNFYTFRNDDEKTYAMMRRADTVGTFQIESRAQMSMLPRLRPKEFYDLVIQIAIIRPGPIQGKVVHPYLLRRSGKTRVNFPDKRLEPILKRTLGVPIFQEQLMRIAIAVGDFTPGEANELRKNIGVWNVKEFERNLNPWIEKLQRGMVKNGFSKEFIDQMIGQMRGFADYGFPESHAISFAFIAYASCYLKCYYPAAYFTSLLNSQPMGFYSPHALLQTAQRDGVKVLPIDVNVSQWDHTLEEVSRDQNSQAVYGIRLGLRLVDSLSRKGAENLMLERQKVGAWKDMDHFVQSAPVHRDDFTALAAAKVFSRFNMSRSEALWYAEAVPVKPYIDIEEKEIEWKTESKMLEIQRDFNAFKTTLEEHPVEIIKKEAWTYPVNVEQVVDSVDLVKQNNNHLVHTFGMITVRQSPPSAKGMVFLTIEDKQGFTNLVFTPDVYRKFYQTVERHAFICVQGKVQKANEHVSIMVKSVYEPQLYEKIGYYTKEKQQWKQVGYQTQQLLRTRSH